MPEIILTSGVGEGLTELSAFDAALHDAGIKNLNLIPLSSVIPTGSKITERKYELDPKHFGYRAYVVISSEKTSKKGETVAAGLGWVINETNGGLFVEHHGYSPERVKEQIKDSLTHMVTYRKEKYGPIQSKTADIKCKDKPVCALVAAIYKVEGWN